MRPHPFPMDKVFRHLASPATYTPPGGEPVPIYVMAGGGGRAERVGSVEVVAEDLSVHVLRTQVREPVVGATVQITGGLVWTVGAVEPLEKDPQQTRWTLRLSWGVPVSWRRPSTTPAPVPVDPLISYAAGAAAGGASAITIICSGWPGGGIGSGDQITIGGQAYTAAGRVSPTFGDGDYVFEGVGITPALVAPLAGGEAVAITAAGPGSETVQAAVADYRANEIMGGVLAGDRRLVIRAEAMSAPPSTSDSVVIGPETWAVVSVETVYSGSAVAVWVVQVRR